MQGGAFGTGAAVPDALVSDFAAGMLRQQGENYFQRGQAFVQSKMGFLSSTNLQYHFNIDSGYGEPLPRRWTAIFDAGRSCGRNEGGSKFVHPL